MVAQEKLAEIIDKNVTVRIVEPHIYTVYPLVEGIGSYDKMGGVYDAVACSRLYNRVMWGYWTSDYHLLCADALRSAKDGWVLDVGCGSLAFTATTYAEYSERPVVLLDQSIRLLRMAKKRLIKLKGSVPPNMVFLHADALELPFKSKSFKTIVCMNLLHVFSDLTRFLPGLKNVAVDRGRISCTTLVLNNRPSDRYLKTLATAGFVVPRTMDELSKIFNDAAIPVKHTVKGNLAFLYH